MYDLIIVGGSAAGVAAAIYAARRRLHFLLISHDIGGEVASSGEIENYPGYVHTDGLEMTKKYEDQLAHNEVPMEIGSDVLAVAPIAEFDKNRDGEKIIAVKINQLSGQEKILEARAVIVASGIKPRHLGVSGETELYHHGVTYCTVCDGPLFKNKITATVGTGNSALESALMMSQIAKKVFVLTKYPSFKGEQVLIDKVESSPNVEILREAITTRVIGENAVSGLEYKNKTGAVMTLDAQGVMVHIGQTPNSGFIQVGKDSNGQIIVDKLCRTNVPGIFAAGDVTDVPYKQIAIASGQGVIAALAAIEYINRN
ncbi:MAG: thioredoxin reductase [Candidatus Magasanikbacteria bacterium]|nr:thioredoxin reductase [Candidatus Magasanikbacteria bacterium]